MEKKIRAISFYLPQFHPIPENDEWWGKGFTEWTNVTKAKPRFKEHYQPHLPADMGFYDLRLNETLVAQARLAKEHGIDGFCFHHYWFSGKKLLEKPIENMLELKSPNFPFCLCWANENWTRKWDGLNENVLIEQTYSDEDDIAHFNYLANFFSDSRYIKIDDKPVLLIYRTEIIPDIKKRTDKWRDLLLKLGFKGLYLINIESFTRGVNPKEIGFDAGFSFQPNWHKLPMYIVPGKIERILHKLNIKKSPFIENKIWNYQDIVDSQIRLIGNEKYKAYPGITPMWDNTSRRKKDAFIYHNSTPELYGKWLQKIKDNFVPFSKDENFIFINAWNEWAEGNHLEPCQKWGKRYLEVTKEILEK